MAHQFRLFPFWLLQPPWNPTYSHEHPQLFPQVHIPFPFWDFYNFLEFTLRTIPSIDYNTSANVTTVKTFIQDPPTVPQPVDPTSAPDPSTKPDPSTEPNPPTKPDPSIDLILFIHPTIHQFQFLYLLISFI